MKKKFLALLLMGTMVLAGCSNQAANEGTNTEDTTEESGSTEEESSDETSEHIDESPEIVDTTPITEETIEELGIDAFMTLGEYKGLELTRTVYTVTDTDVEDQIQSDLASYPVDVTDADATVESGDTANIDYEGKVDGVAFDGGTSQGYDLVIGSGSFIEGFEDQLIGQQVGETKDIQVTFPDPYQNNEDLSGAEATFTVTVNSIQRPLTEVTEEWVQTNTDYDSVDAYRAAVKEQLEANNESASESGLMDDAWEAVFSTAQFVQYPQDVLDDCLEQQKTSYEQYATMYGMEYDAFMEATGITEDDLTAAAKNSVQNVLTMEYICEKEGITEDSQAYQDQLQSLLDEGGYADKQAVLDAGISEFNVDFVVKYNCVMDLLIDNANITDVNAEDEAAEDGTDAATTE